jgi:hypothetical protein
VHRRSKRRAAAAAAAGCGDGDDYSLSAPCHPLLCAFHRAAMLAAAAVVPGRLAQLPGDAVLLLPLYRVYEALEGALARTGSLEVWWAGQGTSIHAARRRGGRCAHARPPSRVSPPHPATPPGSLHSGHAYSSIALIIIIESITPLPFAWSAPIQARGGGRAHCRARRRRDPAALRARLCCRPRRRALRSPLDGFRPAPLTVADHQRGVAGARHLAPHEPRGAA